MAVDDRIEDGPEPLVDELNRLTETVAMLEEKVAELEWQRDFLIDIVRNEVE